MAYGINTGNIIEVRVKSQLNAQTIYNIYHYYVVDATSVTNGATALDGLNLNLTQALSLIPTQLSFSSNDYAIQSIISQVIYPVRYRSIDRPVNLNGAVVGEALPQNSSLSLELYGAKANKHSIGRKALAGVARVYSIAGYWDLAAFATELGLYKTNVLFQRTITASGTMILKPCILNRTAPNTSELVEGVTAQETIRVQRRRTVGVGI